MTKKTTQKLPAQPNKLHAYRAALAAKKAADRKLLDANQWLDQATKEAAQAASDLTRARHEWEASEA